ncbi:MAG: RidA family protein [Chloroflexota bacterium]
MTDITYSERAPEPVGPYPHARRHGDLVFLSGVGPRVRGQGFEAGEPFEDQCRRVIESVQAILEDAGSGWDRMLDVMVFLTHMERDFATFNRIWAEALPDPATRPCRTTIEVGSLPTPIDIELKVVATLRPDDAR